MRTAWIRTNGTLWWGMKDESDHEEGDTLYEVKLLDNNNAIVKEIKS